MTPNYILTLNYIIAPDNALSQAGSYTLYS